MRVEHGDARALDVGEASSAALPVSPLVAVTIMTRRPSPARETRMSCGSICSATSLNALVGPCHSSSVQSCPQGVTGVTSSESKLAP